MCKVLDGKSLAVVGAAAFPWGPTSSS
jgi:hypothetical protein